MKKVIFPYNKYLVGWKFILSFFIFFQFITIPMEIAFQGLYDGEIAMKFLNLLMLIIEIVV